MRQLIKEYFSFENHLYFDSKNLIENLTEEFVLQGERYLQEQGMDCSNIYFKLLAQLYFLEDTNEDVSLVSYVNYLIGYYVGLFLHPIDGEYLALKYINKAIELEADADTIGKYKEVISMIKEEL